MQSMVQEDHFISKISEIPYMLEGRELTKRFGNLVANDHINFGLFPGEVHAVLGENGAGKSTLMKIFYGLLQPDEGDVIVNGGSVWFQHPSDAIQHGIGMVHQELMLIPYMSVTENIILGREITQGRLLLDSAKADQEVKALAEKYGFNIDPKAPVGGIPIGVQQRVEILKALYRQADILILDEPTSLLTPQEADELFRIIRQLAYQGKSVIFITHKLKEVYQVADRMTVLRNGHVIGTTTPSETDEKQLAEMMVGREVKPVTRRSKPQKGKPLFKADGVLVRDENNRILLDHISFEIEAGQILGIAGIEGNGQTELAEAILGLRRVTQGHFFFQGEPIENRTTKYIRTLGIGSIPDDRQRLGLILPFKISENLILNNYQNAPFAQGIRQKWNMVTTFANHIADVFDIRSTSVTMPVNSLSGGNQQKVVVGRELSFPLRLLVASQPTRGVDIASVDFIHRKILDAADSGTAVLLISSDLDELLAITDRIMVMLRGRSQGFVETRTTNKQILGQMMLGLNDQVERRSS